MTDPIAPQPRAPDVEQRHLLRDLEATHAELTTARAQLALARALIEVLLFALVTSTGGRDP